MNFRRFTAAAMFVAALLILPAYAQTARPAAGTGTGAAAQPTRPASGGTTAAAQPTRPAPTGGAAMTAFGGGAIAIINTEAFTDEKAGIAKLVAAAGGVSREFQPRRTELQTLQTNIQKSTEDLAKKAPVQEQRATAAQQEQIDTMKRDLERKSQDAQLAYQKRLGEVLGPLYEDIGKNLEAFAKQRGIGLVLDISKLGGAAFPTSDAMDITAAFVTEYNSRNPSTASNTAPGR